MEAYNIALVDDHELVREGFAHLITLHPQFTIKLSCSNAEELLEKLSNQDIDVLISDIMLPEMDGLSLAQHVKDRFPTIKIIMLSMYESSHYVDKASAIGVEGYVPKKQAAKSLIEAINTVIKNKTYFDRDIEGLNEKSKQLYNKYLTLTDKEKQIFIGIAKGQPIKKVAFNQDIAIKTVHAHKSKIFDKLEVRDDFSITRIAIKLGLIDVLDF